MIDVVALSVAFTWIHNGTGGSILAIILLHSWTNFTMQTVEGTLRTDLLFYAGTLWAFVVFIAIVYGVKTLERGRDVPHPALKARSSARSAPDQYN